MSEDDKPPSPHEHPAWAERKPPGAPEPSPSGPGDFFFKLGKAIVFLIVGIFVLGGLVFATCLLAIRL